MGDGPPILYTPFQHDRKGKIILSESEFYCREDCYLVTNSAVHVSVVMPEGSSCTDHIARMPQRLTGMPCSHRSTEGTANPYLSHGLVRRTTDK